jgi:hypothetical protein
MTYSEQVYGFVVYLMGTHHSVYWTDGEDAAIRFALHHDQPLVVIRSSDDERIYCNV